ncbi:MAG: response regulator [Roseobacter sp.]
MAKVLILEDDVVFGFQLKTDLEKSKHVVDVCTTASAAIENLWLNNYDLLISDIIVKKKGHSIPDGGIRLIGWVRQNPETNALPIIAITGAHKLPGMLHVLTTAEQVGANVALEKPFNIADLLANVDHLVASSRE